MVGMDWFTPPRRKAIYQVGIAVGVLLLAAGVITTDDLSKTESVMAVATSCLLALTNFLAALNVNPEA